MPFVEDPDNPGLYLIGPNVYVTAEPLASAGDYTSITGLSPARAEWDLAAASAAIRRQAGWHIWPILQEEMTVNGTGARELFLPTGRLVDVSACSHLYRGNTTPTEVAVGTLEWSAAGWLYNPYGWTNRLRGVVVTIEHGYDAVPDLAALCLDLAVRVNAGPAGIVRESAGMRSIEYARALTEQDHATIERYRITV